MDWSAQEAKFGPLSLGSAPKSDAPKKKGNWITSLIPTVGSILGGIGGSIVAPGAGTAAGGAAGGVLGKKLQDIITGNHSSVASYLGEGAMGSLGGLGEGVSAIKGAGSALKAGEGIADAAKVLRYGQEGAQALKGFQGLSAAEKAIEATGANEGRSTLLSKVAGKANKVADSAMLSQSGGLTKNTAESAVRDVAKMRDLGYSNLGKMAEHAPAITGRLENPGVITRIKDMLLSKGAPVDTSNFMQTARDAIASNAEIVGPSEKKLLSQVQKIADKYGFQGGTDGIGVTTAKNFNAAMRELEGVGYNYNKMSPFRGTILDITKGMRQPLEASLANVPIENSTKEAAVSLLKARGVDNPKLFKAISGAETASDLSKIEAPFVTAGKMAKEGAASELTSGAKMFDKSGTKLTGMLNEAAGTVIGTPVKSGTAKVAGMLGRVGGKGVAPVTLADVAKLSGKDMLKAQIPARIAGSVVAPAQTDAMALPDTTQPTLDSSGAPVDFGASQTQDQGTTPTASTATSDTTPVADTTGLNTSDLKSRLQQAAIEALSKGDSKGLDSIVKVAGLIQSFEPDKAAAKVSAQQAKAMQDMQNALSSLDYLDSQVGKGSGLGLKGLLAKVPGVRQYAGTDPAAYDSTKIEIATSLAKAITGSSRPPESVIKQYTHSLPQVTDTPEFAQKKLANLRREITTRLQSTANYPTDQTDVTSILDSLGAAQ